MNDKNGCSYKTKNHKNDNRPNNLQIIGCAMLVHTALGTGFQEVIYQRSLASELDKTGLIYLREKEQPIYNKIIQVGTRRADFIIEDQVMVELKALSNLEDIHLIQAKNYLSAYGLNIGPLINFGHSSL